MTSLWELTWKVIKTTVMAGLIGWGIIWGYGKLAHMGETSGTSIDQKSPRSAEEIMRPPSKPKKW